MTAKLHRRCRKAASQHQGVSVQLGPVSDLAALGRRWRELEQRAAGSFFQSWTWVGCLAEERYARPLLVEATEAGRTLALGLFNRRPGRLGLDRLYLQESGAASLDSPYIEQNGVLCEAGRETELTALCLGAVALRFRVELSGIEAPTLAAAQAGAKLVVVQRCQDTPFADLASIRRSGRDILSGRSANTRQQIRRSDRHYTCHGPIRVTRAETLPDALAALDRLQGLHQAAWQARGQPGSFAVPFFRRFHQALIAEGLSRGEIALLEVFAGELLLGVLYNFVWADRMLAYQSGFAYLPGVTQARPGLSSHHAAMRYALEIGLNIYDFLAGDDRYKRSLSDASRPMHWVSLGPLMRLDLVLEWLRKARSFAPRPDQRRRL